MKLSPKISRHGYATILCQSATQIECLGQSIDANMLNDLASILRNLPLWLASFKTHKLIFLVEMVQVLVIKTLGDRGSAD